MRSVSVRLSDLEKVTIPIGFVGENIFTKVYIDCKKVFDEHPTAIPALSVSPPKGDSYPAVTTRDGDMVIWEVTASDLVNDGSGQIQLAFVHEEMIGKSWKARIKIYDSIEPSGEVPTAIANWLISANAALNAIPETINEALAEAKASGEFDGADGFSPTVSITAITGGYRISITDKDGTYTADVLNGTDGHDGIDGDDGYSPTVSITSITGGHRVTITDKNGDHTADIMDGVDGDPGSPGDPGQDGYSPTVAITDITCGHTVTITDKNGSHAFNVMDGVSAIDDNAGVGDTDKVWSADKSASENSLLSVAINGKISEPASEGTSGQFLQTDGNGGRTWATPSGGGGGVSDIQVNGTSVVTQGVANIPMPDNTTFGVVKVGSSAGVGIGIDANGRLQTQRASGGDCKLGTHNHAPVTPAIQHESVFYALSKVAGEDLKNDTVTTGTYPEKSKSAIHQMLDAPETVSGSTPSITAKAGVRYVCGECSTLTIVVPASGIIDVVFDSGSTPTVLTVTPPTGMTMRWIGDDPTALEANKHYEINIMDGCNGMVVSWT